MYTICVTAAYGPAPEVCAACEFSNGVGYLPVEDNCRNYLQVSHLARYSYSKDITRQMYTNSQSVTSAMQGLLSFGIIPSSVFSKCTHDSDNC